MCIFFAMELNSFIVLMWLGALGDILQFLFFPRLFALSKVDRVTYIESAPKSTTDLMENYMHGSTLNVSEQLRKTLDPVAKWENKNSRQTKSNGKKICVNVRWTLYRSHSVCIFMTDERLMYLEFCTTIIIDGRNDVWMRTFSVACHWHETRTLKK